MVVDLSVQIQSVFFHSQNLCKEKRRRRRRGMISPKIAQTTSRLGLRYTQMSNALDVEFFRVFVATWNVGGKPPHCNLNLDNFLRVEDPSDIYVLGFQEIVPLNAGNVLVIEDNEPAARWLALINMSLNRPPAEVDNYSSPSTRSAYRTSKSLVCRDTKHRSGLLFFQKTSLKSVSKNFRTEKGRRLKTCNCSSEMDRKYRKGSCFKCQQTCLNGHNSSSEEGEGSSGFVMTEIASASCGNRLNYSLVASKQMVGIFVTVWVRKELVQHVGHLRFSCVGRGIMGYLGNKGCITVSMSLHQTSFCFICSHLASGEKEGDEIRRNCDVIEILKNTQFPKMDKRLCRRTPERILDHDRIIWFGDLNYRISLSYGETRKLLEMNNWDTLLKKDQLKIEREAGRVFKGWKEGKIYFAPTYKYSTNSDAYAGDSSSFAVTSKEKRRTPAWCDRILWHGDGTELISYTSICGGESRFSDHRPVCALFLVQVVVVQQLHHKGLTTSP